MGKVFQRINMVNRLTVVSLFSRVSNFRVIRSKKIARDQTPVKFVLSVHNFIPEKFNDTTVQMNYLYQELSCHVLNPRSMRSVCETMNNDFGWFSTTVV
jgi:hypothetical protein